VASLKKDGIAHMGGLLALNDEELAKRCELLVIATEGFRTYGGLTGRDLDMLAQGLVEVTDPLYLRSRAAATGYLAEVIGAAGVSIVQPAGIHALYLNAGRLLPHLPPGQFPGHALACELYLQGGIRSFELVRLAIPRRVYTQSHLEYVGEILAKIAKDPERVPGYRLVEIPTLLRHFNCRLVPLPGVGES